MRQAVLFLGVMLGAAMCASGAATQQRFAHGWTVDPRRDLTTTLNSGSRYCQMVHLGPQDDPVAPAGATIVFICLRQFQLHDQIFAIANTNAVTPSLKWTIDTTGLESSSINWIPRHVAGYNEASDVLFVAFTVNGDIDGAGTNSYSGGLDCAILALSGSSGTVTWAVQFGTSQDDTAFGTVYVAPQDRVYIAGTSAGNIAGGADPATDQVFICTYTTAGAVDTCRQDVDPVITSAIKTKIPATITTHNWLEVGNMAYNATVGAIFITANGCTSYTSSYGGVNLIQRYNLDLTRAWGVAAPLNWYMLTGVLYIDGMLWVSGSTGRARIARFNADTGAHIDTWSDPLTSHTSQRRMTRPRFNGTHVVASGILYEGGLGGNDFKYYVWETDFTARESVYWGASSTDRADDLMYVRDSDASKIAFLYTGTTTDVSSLGSSISSGHVIGKYVIEPGCIAGLYGSEKEPCTECAPATFSSSSGFETCSKCQPGTYDSLNATARTTVCDLCPAGYYQDEFEKLTCKACPAGYYSDAAGQTSCKPCSIGTASSIVGLASECSACAADTFQNMTGQTSCHPCPEGSTSSAGESVCTVCDYGYYADGGCQSCAMGSYSDIQGAVKCKECPFDTGTTSSASTSLSVCFCLQGQYGSKEAKRRCKACAEGTECPLNSEWPQALPGFYVTTDIPDKPLRCVPRSSCPGGIAQCAVGYEGNACSQCTQGYYRAVQNCAKCFFSAQLGTAGVVTGSVLGFVVVIAGSFLVVWLLLGFFISRDKLQNHVQNHTPTIKTAAVSTRFQRLVLRSKRCFDLLRRAGSSMNGMQKRANLISKIIRLMQVLGIVMAVDIAWPAALVPVRILSMTASLFDFNIIFPIDCFFTSDEVYILRIVTFVVSIVAGACLVFIPVVGLAFLLPLSRYAAARIIGIVFAFATTFYVNLHSLALDKISCFERVAGEFYLNSSPDVKCFTVDGQWIYSLPQTLVMMVLFSLGIPATILLGVALLHRRQQSRILQVIFGGHSQKYHPAMYYYEIMIFAEKFLIGMSQVLSSVGAREQVAYLATVVCFFFVDFIRSKPLRVERDLVFESCFRMCIVAAIMIAFALQCQVSDVSLYILTVLFYFTLLSVIVLFMVFMLPSKWTDSILRACRCLPSRKRGDGSALPKQEASPFDTAEPDANDARVAKSVTDAESYDSHDDRGGLSVKPPTKPDDRQNKSSVFDSGQCNAGVVVAGTSSCKPGMLGGKELMAPLKPAPSGGAMKQGSMPPPPAPAATQTRTPVLPTRSAPMPPALTRPPPQKVSAAPAFPKPPPRPMPMARLHAKPPPPL